MSVKTARSGNWLDFLTWSSVAVSVAVLSVLVEYLYGKDSNHTGVEPWLLAAVFAPTAILGVLQFVRRGYRWGGLLACCLGVGGLAYLAYLDTFNVLLEYERWIRRGMP